MPGPELSLIFLRPLNQLGIRYMVSGSVAAIMYGEPRLTHDVDLIVFLRGNDIDSLLKSFTPPTFYLPPKSLILEETARPAKGHFNIIHIQSGFKADIYPAGRDELRA